MLVVLHQTVAQSCRMEAAVFPAYRDTPWRFSVAHLCRKGKLGFLTYRGTLWAISGVRCSKQRNPGFPPLERDILEIFRGCLCKRVKPGRSGAPRACGAQSGMRIPVGYRIGPLKSWEHLPGAAGEHGCSWCTHTLNLTFATINSTNWYHLCCGHKFWAFVAGQGLWTSVCLAFLPP